ncbi:MAG: ABC transporter substrate-binding protein [Fulvivirga sp.]|nr:ABC transporter substrate-binding protein [Fulvivirga sp.]
MLRHTITIFIISTLVSCGPTSENTANKQSVDNDQKYLKYAQGFEVRYEGNVKWVTVPKPFQGATEGFTYLLVPKGTKVPDHSADVQVIEIPLDRLVCNSTTHIPLLDYLGKTEALVGFPTTDYISSKKMRQRIDAGKVTDIGVDNEMNLELLIDLEPDMVMAYTVSNNFGQFEQISKAGIPVVINAEYLESHPLGRAEWIKFMALFFNLEDKADSIFNAIETKYVGLQEKTARIQEKPTVLSGVVYGDTWYMPGGDNYAAKIINDAAGNYLWSENDDSGFLELSFEAVYDRAHDADYWIGVGSFNTLEALQNADDRYAKFKSFKTGDVYTYDARKGAKGGSVYLELGYLRPDIILEDLVKILHPQLTNDKDLYFHAKLK